MSEIDKLYIETLEHEIKKLKAKIRRLQDGRLAKFAMAAMQGILTQYADIDGSEEEIAEWSVKQAKALIKALEEEK